MKQLTKEEKHYLSEFISERLQWGELWDGEEEILVGIKDKLELGK
jgi:hypothetical protein